MYFEVLIVVFCSLKIVATRYECYATTSQCLVLLNGAKILLKYTKMGQMLKMPQNLNYPENSEFFFRKSYTPYY
jgi:hypothetical protein